MLAGVLMKVIAEIVRALHSDKPKEIFVSLYKAFIGETKEGVVLDIEPAYIASEYVKKYSEKIPGESIDLFAATQMIYLNPEAIFDNPGAFVNLVLLLNGVQPDYTRDVSPSIYELTNAYVFVKYILSVPYNSSVLSSATADVIALAMYEAGEWAFPDERVMKYSLPAMHDGYNKTSDKFIQSAWATYSMGVLPAIYLAESREDATKAIFKITDDNPRAKAILNSTKNMFITIIDALFEAKELIKGD